MEISRLTFRKETKDKMKKEMTVREKGRVLFDKLKGLDEDGTLSKASNRADVARLVGYSEERSKAGYAWVSNLIRRGHLTETVREWTPSGKMVAEYHMTGSAPDYGYEEVKRRRAKKKVGQELRRWQDKVAAGQIPQDPSILICGKEQIPVDTPPSVVVPIKVEITRGDMTIKVEMGDHEQASKLITTIMKGE